MVTQYDVELVHQVEAVVGTTLAAYDMPEKEVLKGITKVGVNSRPLLSWSAGPFLRHRLAGRLRSG